VYELRILDPAVRDLEKLDGQVARRILARLRWLSENFDNLRPEALAGDMAGLFKLRVGDYRVIYEPLLEDRTLVIHIIGHRSEVYRRR
jgi:mRNA interferase RelE/StbE